MGWASLAAGLLVASITFFTSYSHVDLFGFIQFKVNQQIGIPLLLAAMAALFGEDEVFSVGVVELAPTIDAQIKGLESERRTKLIENDIERLEKENKRLADIESRLDALLLSADSSSPIPPATDSN
jgi:hypothetical protein